MEDWGKNRKDRVMEFDLLDRTKEIVAAALEWVELIQTCCSKAHVGIADAREKVSLIEAEIGIVNMVSILQAAIEMAEKTIMELEDVAKQIKGIKKDEKGN